jgi:hypothetical protein
VDKTTAEFSLSHYNAHYYGNLPKLAIPALWTEDHIVAALEAGQADD